MIQRKLRFDVKTLLSRKFQEELLLLTKLLMSRKLEG